MVSMQNLGPTVILKSPLHPIMSKGFLVLQWTGRKSGKTFAAPVGYVPGDDGALLVTSDSTWVQNFTGGAPVTVWFRGKKRTARAELVDDREAAAEAIQRMVKAYPSWAKNAEVRPSANGEIDLDACRVASATRRLVRITL